MIDNPVMELRVTAFCCLLVVALLLPYCWSDTKRAKSGGYTIVFEADGDQVPTITVLQDERNSPVWFSSPASSFVKAVKMKQRVFQNGGDFVISSTVEEECLNATYDNFTVRGNPPNIFVIITGHLCEAQFAISFQAVTAVKFEHLQLNVSLSSAVYNQLWLTYGCEEDEGFFGFGAQYTYLNMKKRRLPLFLSEQGIGRGLEPITILLDKASPGAGDDNNSDQYYEYYVTTDIL